MQDLTYEGFFEDFGPLNLAKIWKYINEVLKFLTDKKYSESIFYHLTSPHYSKCANSALLVCAYLVPPTARRLSSSTGHPSRPLSLSNTSTSGPFEMLATGSAHTNAR